MGDLAESAWCRTYNRNSTSPIKPETKGLMSRLVRQHDTFVRKSEKEERKALLCGTKGHLRSEITDSEFGGRKCAAEDNDDQTSLSTYRSRRDDVSISSFIQPLDPWNKVDPSNPTTGLRLAVLLTPSTMRV